MEKNLNKFLIALISSVLLFVGVLVIDKVSEESSYRFALIENPANDDDFAYNKIVDHLSKDTITYSKSDSDIFYKLGKIKGQPIKDNEIVIVKYKLSLLSGKEMISYVEEKINLGKEELVEGLKEAIILTGKGGSGVFYLPPKTAYGNKWTVNKIPANSPIICQIESIK